MWLTVSVVILALGAEAGNENELALDMQAHFSEVTLIQAALIEGDLARARELACILSEHEEPAAMPEAWRPLTLAFKSEAQRVYDAESLPGAAAAAARSGAACGACHERLGAHTWLASTSEEPLGARVEDRMARHRWALDRMWEGLIGPSEASWQAGADALAETPLPSARMVGEEQIRAEMLANQVYRLAGEARQASDPAARAHVYGRLLAVCAECHRLFRPAD